MEGRIALLDERELTVDIPAVGCDRPRIAARIRRCVGVCKAELAVEPQPQRLDVEGRLVACARWKNAGDGSEAVVEIFSPRRPARRDRKLGAEAERPARAREQDLVLIAG